MDLEDMSLWLFPVARRAAETTLDKTSWRYIAVHLQHLARRDDLLRTLNQVALESMHPTERTAMVSALRQLADEMEKS